MADYTVISEFLTYGWTAPILLQYIYITPNPLTMAVWSTQQFTCTGHWSDGHEEDLTLQVNWYSWDGNLSLDSSVNIGLGTALPYNPTGLVNAEYYDTNQGQWFYAENTVDITGGLGFTQGIDVLWMAGSPSYTGAESNAYLEPYPMWNGNWQNYTVGTPNPPKTGHALFTYTSGTGVFTVTDSVGQPFQGLSRIASPWNYDWYPLTTNSNGPQYVTKGLAGSTWVGTNSSDNTNWLKANVMASTSTSQLRVTLNTALTLPASTNYYGQTLLADSSTGNGYQLNGVGGGSSGMLHVISQGPTTPPAWSSSTTYNKGNKVSYLGDNWFSTIASNLNKVPGAGAEWELLPPLVPYDFTTVTDVRFIATEGSYTARSPVSLKFKALSAQDILIYLSDTAGPPWVYDIWPVNQFGQIIGYSWYLIEFTTPAGVFVNNTSFYLFLGV